MRHLAAYLLLVLGGNATPSADDITNVVAACGGEADGASIEAFLADIEGKNLDEIYESGKEKIKDAGSVAVAAAPAGGAAAGAAPAAAAAPVKEEAEEVDLGGGMDMFGGGGDGGAY